jgi:hypothetical protein
METINDILENIQKNVFSKSIIVNTFEEIEDEVDMEGTFIYNRETETFYGHDGGTWKPISIPKDHIVLRTEDVEYTCRLENSKVLIYYNDIPITTISNSNITIEHPKEIIIESPYIILKNKETVIKLEYTDTNVYIKNEMGKIPFANEFAVIHCELKIKEEIYPYININEDLPLFFDNIESWNVVFENSYKEFIMQKTKPYITIETNTERSAYGFFGGYHKPLPKGIYKLTLNANIYKAKKFNKYEEWKVMVISKNSITDTVSKIFSKTYSCEWLESLKTTNPQMPFHSNIQQTIFFVSSGIEYIAPNITSFSGIYQLSDVTFIIEKLN